MASTSRRAAGNGWVKLQLETCVQPEVDPQPSNFGQYTNKMHFLSKNILNELCEKDFAVDFLGPVDLELIDAEEYYETVAKPMDLGTIMQRLNNKFYHHVGEAVSDFMLIIHNCFQYNRSGSIVHERGQFLEKYFMKRIMDIPKGIEYPYGQVSKTMRRTRTVPAPSMGPPPPRSRIMTRQTAQLQLQPELPASWENPPTLVQPDVGPEPMNLGKHTNKLDFFERFVLEEACRRDFCSEFMQPVDTVLLGVPQYYTIITKPMDIRTMRQRMCNSYYHHMGEAVSDFMLIIHNCFKYNQPGDDVYKNGQLLDDFFWKQLQLIPTGPETPSGR
ncbi:bromodomain testis-specific protein-like [Drosophila obscura]|uniref:bromodomain testis-specific protein-like n=1 Tax=Drosophila obscura TaxID=7282 RepID=UPI000BA0CDFC|nr:bromodomain testis-specific protein-like [Drosophila obscura]